MNSSSSFKMSINILLKSLKSILFKELWQIWRTQSLRLVVFLLQISLFCWDMSKCTTVVSTSSSTTSTGQRRRKFLRCGRSWLTRIASSLKTIKRKGLTTSSVGTKQWRTKRTFSSSSLISEKTRSQSTYRRPRPSASSKTKSARRSGSLPASSTSRGKG